MLPTPVTRKEKYLSKAAGGQTQVPEKPITREEMYLAKIAEGGGGGGTSDYEDLTNQPQINGQTLMGDQTGAELGLVDAEEGKGLSTNDFTDAAEEKLSGLANIQTVGNGLTLDNGELSTGITVVNHGITI